MATLVKMAKPCFNKHYNIYYHTTKNVESMKACYSKKITPKCYWSQCIYMLSGLNSKFCNYVMRYSRAPWVVRNGGSNCLKSAIY